MVSSARDERPRAAKKKRAVCTPLFLVRPLWQVLCRALFSCRLNSALIPWLRVDPLSEFLTRPRYVSAVETFMAPRSEYMAVSVAHGQLCSYPPHALRCFPFLISLCNYSIAHSRIFAICNIYKILIQQLCKVRNIFETRSARAGSAPRKKESATAHLGKSSKNYYI